MVLGEVVDGWKRELAWAPALLLERYGPSVCAPKRDAELGISLGDKDGRICDC